MFRKTALVMVALAATVLWTGNANARGRHCGSSCGGSSCGGSSCHSGGCGGGSCYGGGCGGGSCYSGSCGGGGCYGGSCSTGGCYGGSCAVGGGCANGQCAIGGARVVAGAPAQAYIVVSLPADAKLLIDNKPTASTSETRTFVTPELAAGKDFVYTLTAKIMRDGKEETISQEVTVKAGKESKVSLTLPTAAVAAK